MSAGSACLSTHAAAAGVVAVIGEKDDYLVWPDLDALRGADIGAGYAGTPGRPGGQVRGIPAAVAGNRYSVLVPAWFGGSWQSLVTQSSTADIGQVVLRDSVQPGLPCRVVEQAA